MGGEDAFDPQLRATVWPALAALSKIGLDHVPDLPAPTDASYPEQCLGLQLLLDFCPRLFCQGVDHRWTYGYFRSLSERVAKAWHALPPAQRPDGWERWRQGGAGVDCWIGARLWLNAPFVHAECRADQALALQFTNDTRRFVERLSGLTDPNRARRDDILADLHGFPRVYVEGPPLGADVTRESWTFWAGMLIDIHKPIIDWFGRYPYLNAVLGRQSTAEEEVWIEETGHLNEAEREVARIVAEDVRLRRWTPPGGCSPR
ncbi:hypothetical protein B0T24DRAFT_670911 [Lasiosphaeria ovina]|uniref:Uncharacterized protein n=1 Tax=Lasiosphaeria ovina TaxID=92902 RepID=A0AAE0JUX6_9PEZI|nr:hypothetical protein B0T24DRAFT_670911 [Lasiosphaeria ovina]